MPAMQPPTYLINLDRSADRLERMRAEADQFGFTFERVPGVDGASEVPEWLSEQFVIESAMSSGEIGCYASHMTVWKRVRDQHLDYAIVLEDDAEVPDGFAGAAHAAIAAAPPDWDIIHLSTNFKRPSYPVANIDEGRSLVRYARLPANTAAYLISRSGCAKLLTPAPRMRPVDMEFRYAWLRGLEVYGVYPALVGEHCKAVSTIQAAWRRPYIATEGQRKRSHIQVSWKPSLRSQIDGWFFVKQRLGLRGMCYVWFRRVLDLVRPRRTPRRAINE